MKLLQKIKNKLIFNKYYKWNITRRMRYLDNRKKLFKGYIHSTKTENKSKKVICIFDGRIQQGGLADRLRGIISVYQICKELKLDFYIHFTSPFQLNQYLVPNKVNWQITSAEISNNLSDVKICYLDTVTDSPYERRKQKDWLKNKLSKNYNEFHVFTNAAFSYENDYSNDFKELFKYSDKLNDKICTINKELHNKYISISCRFLDLLGDFNEYYASKEILNDEAKEAIIKRNLEQILHLHEKYPDYRILLNSDSKLFLNRATSFDFVYIIPGEITHIDNDNNSYYERYEKTFLDFFMISGAESIYLLKHRGMHNSGYPYAASLITNKSFFRIEF